VVSGVTNTLRVTLRPEMLRHIALLFAAAVIALPASAFAHPTAVHLLGYPSIVKFGRQQVGETSDARVTITNEGDAAMLLGPAGITSLQGDPAFGMTDPAEGACFASGEIAELPVGESCSIIVNFTPPAPGRYRAQLFIQVVGAADVSVRVMGSGAHA
jgi:hypothetical protein